MAPNEESKEFAMWSSIRGFLSIITSAFGEAVMIRLVKSPEMELDGEESAKACKPLKRRRRRKRKERKKA
jgi:hypothetical protein